MKSKFTWILTLCLVLIVQISFAQERSISGTVVSKKDNMTLPGVNIIVKGTNRGVQTDFDGKFVIKASEGEQLEISFLGSKTKVVTVGASNQLNIQLEEDVTALDEIVIEGYNVTKTRATSNVASVTIGAATIEERPNANFMNSMQGQVAGVNVFTASGDPGASPSVRIRGIGTLSGDRNPLYVLDGIPLNSDDFQSLDANEFESVTVLKDAGAAAVYGNRGANGVIVIKTKRGKYDTSLNIRYNTYSGFSFLQNDNLDMMTSQQLLTYERANGVGFGANYGGAVNPITGLYVGAPMTDAQIAAMPNTDWRDTFFRTGLTQSHDLSLTSGGANISSYTSLGYFSQDGTVPQSSLQRFNFKNNLNGKSANDRFNYSTTVSLNFSKNQFAAEQGSGNTYSDPTYAAVVGVPYLTPSDYPGSDGLVKYYLASPDAAAIDPSYSYNGTGYVPGDNTVYQPLYVTDAFNNTRAVNEQIKSIVGLEGSYKIVDDLTLSSSFGLDYLQDKGNSFTSPNAFLYKATARGQAGQPVGSQGDVFSYTASVNAITKLNYNKKFGKSTVDGTLYIEYNKYYSRSASQNLFGFDPKVATPGTSAGYTPIRGDQAYFPTVSFAYASSGLFSYFGTVDYDYDGKYGIGGTLRRDASSNFNETNRWGTFYNVTGRWNINKEEFMQNSGFSLLKLRGSYGTSGNKNIAGGIFSSLTNQYDLYSAITGYNNTQAYAFAQIGVNDLRWETTIQGDLGLDFEFLRGRVGGSLDVYHRKADDLFQNVPISPINGTSSINKNYGSMENEGVELQLRWDVVQSKSNDGFNFTLRANTARNWNKVLEVGSETGIVDPSLMNVTAVGHTFAEFYAVKYIGVNPANGNLLFEDKNGDPTETPTDADKVFTGKTVAPRLVGGFGFDTDYKGFYMNTSFSYAYKQYAVASELASVQNAVGSIGISNLSTDVFRAWTPTNVNTDIPSLTATNIGAAGVNNDRYIRDASYLRLKNLTFGYAFPKSLLKKSFFNTVKVYTMAENMVTFTKWRGLDVETNMGGTTFGYPVAKIYTFGLQLDF